jgi:hypothetical protein
MSVQSAVNHDGVIDGLDGRGRIRTLAFQGRRIGRGQKAILTERCDRTEFRFAKSNCIFRFVLAFKSKRRQIRPRHIHQLLIDVYGDNRSGRTHHAC